MLADHLLPAQGFFPHQIGDAWYYTCMVNANVLTRERAIVRDTVLPNGYTYAVGGAIALGMFHRVQNDTVLLHAEIDSEDYVFLTRTAQVGDTLCWFPKNGVHEPIIVVNVDTDTMYSLGRTWYGPRWTISLFDSQSVRSGPGTPYYTWTIQDSLGVWSTSDGLTGEMCSLQGARLGGIAYGTTVGVAGSLPSEIPHATQLSAYPNPFNPSTIIEIEGSSQLTDPVLRIFDMLGREVDHIDLGTSRTTPMTVQWAPSQLSSGTYFARVLLSTGIGFTRLVLLR